MLLKTIDQLLASPTLIGLSIALLISSSISIFDVRVAQAKKSGVLPPDHPDLPGWVAIFIWIEWILKIVFLVLNWRVGLLVIAALFALKVLPVLETFGSILMAPFKNPRSKCKSRMPNVNKEIISQRDFLLQRSIRGQTIYPLRMTKTPLDLRE